MSEHRLRNNSKLDPLKGRFKHCLTIFSRSAILKWRDHCTTDSLETTPIDEMCLFDTLGIDLEEYHDEDFRLHFHLGKDSVIDLVKILEKDLQHQTRRGLLLTPMQQVLIALRLYATGTFQRVIGDLFGVSAFAACTAVDKVSRAIEKQRAQKTWLIQRESFMMLCTFQV